VKVEAESEAGGKFAAFQSPPRIIDCAGSTKAAGLHLNIILIG
jgi:hypothetical protein